MMKNYQVLENDSIQTPFGIFGSVSSIQEYHNGNIASIHLSDKNMIVTHAGELIPAYTETPRRKYKYSVEFHNNGMIKSVALEQMQEVHTPIGEFPAELISFYDTGEFNRFFTLDGKISAFWSEDEEKELNVPLSFDIGFAQFTAMLNGVAFYKSGDIRSITLFPKETISINTPVGTVDTGVGLALYDESGKLKSIEPLEPTMVVTPIGKVFAYNSNAIAINADSNSLKFDEQGRIISLITDFTRIAVQIKDGSMLWLKPTKTINPIQDDDFITIGLEISFNYDDNSVTIIEDKNTYTFNLNECGFTTATPSTDIPTCTPLDCANCSLNCSQNDSH